MGKTSKKEAAEARNIKNEELLELGEVVLDGNKEKRKTQLLSIIDNFINSIKIIF